VSVSNKNLLRTVGVASTNAVAVSKCNTVYSAASDDARETTSLIQRLVLLLQRFSSLLIHDSFAMGDANWTSTHSSILSLIFVFSPWTYMTHDK